VVHSDVKFTSEEHPPFLWDNFLFLGGKVLFLSIYFSFFLLSSLLFLSISL